MDEGFVHGVDSDDATVEPLGVQAMFEGDKIEHLYHFQAVALAALVQLVVSLSELF